jgi:hypothetical protein
MATGTYAPDPDLRIVDANGVPISGGLIWTYLAGTTTPVATYTDVGLTIPNSNPIVAGSDGRFVAFLTPGLSYKFVYEQAATPPAHGTVVATRDNILGVPLTVSTTMKVTVRTDSGTVNGWDVSLTDNTLVEWNGSGNLVVNGLSGGVTGRTVTIKNLTGTPGAVIYCVNGTGPAGMQFRNPFLVGKGVPIANMGWATYIYDGTIWTLVSHEQGAWIIPPFNAATFSAASGTWTVVAGNVGFFGYKVVGRSCTVSLYLLGASTTLSATTTNVFVSLPDALQPDISVSGAALSFNAAASVLSTILADVTNPRLALYANAPGLGNFAAGTFSTNFSLTFSLT